MHGTVTSARTHGPVANAKVRVIWKYAIPGKDPEDPEKTWSQLAPPTEVVTDAQGRYALPMSAAWAKVPYCFPEMEVSHESFGKRTSMISLRRPEINVTLDAVNKLTGTLVDSSGKPLANVEIKSRSSGMGCNIDDQTKTDSDGAFTVHVTALRGQHRSRIYAFPADLAAIEVDPILPLKTPLVAPAGTAVTGQVLDEHNQPLEGIGIEVTANNNRSIRAYPLRSARTDKDGRYRLMPLGPDKYEIAIDTDDWSLKNKYLPQSITMPAAGGSIPTVDFRPVRQVTISTKLVDGAGNPIHATWVMLDANMDGMYVSRNLSHVTPDTLSGQFPAGLDHVALGFYSPPGKTPTISCYRRADGILHHGDYVNLGRVDADITDLTLVQLPAGAVDMNVHWTGGAAPIHAKITMKYAEMPPSKTPPLVVVDDARINPTFSDFQTGKGTIFGEILPGRPVEYTVEKEGFTTVTGTFTLKANEVQKIDVALELAPN